MADSLLEPDDTLQKQGEAVLARLGNGDDGREEAAGLVEGLRARDWEGDDLLAEDLEAALAGTPVLARRLPVALDELANQLFGDPMQEPGMLDLQTGEVIPGFMSDPGMVGDDDAIDFEEEPERWLSLPPPESRPGWRDMALFAERTEPPLRDRLEVALNGKGAFRRFKDELFRAELLRDFHAFSDDRERGRARQFLADHGIRAVPPHPAAPSTTA